MCPRICKTERHDHVAHENLVKKLVMAGLVPAIPALLRHALGRRGCPAQAGHDEIKRSTTSLACDAQAKLGEDVAWLPSDSENPIEKARYRFPGAGLILAMLNICR
jgi:hypothetical protein